MGSFRFLLLLGLTGFLLHTSAGAGLSCRDDDGNAVDWYYAYKVPRNASDPTSDPSIKYGDAYMFLLSSTPDAHDWTWSPWGTDNATSMMGRTLAPIYTQPRDPDLLFVLYNDENPDGNTSYTSGHSKGVLVMDQDSGFWLVHAVPKYPPWKDQPYGYPSSGHEYGQNFLCFNLDISKADDVGIQFQYTVPQIYDYNLPSWAETTLPNLYNTVLNGLAVTSPPWYRIVDLESVGGQLFTSFAKHTNYGLDLYADLVAPTLDTNLLVETWNHGSDELPTECSPYYVMNVDEVRVSPKDYVYENYDDHSKWAVAPANDSAPWICSGDINRMGSQEGRAGGTVCTQSVPVWQAFSASVTAVEPCPASK